MRLSPYVVDGQCISYLTIENEAPFECRQSATVFIGGRLPAGLFLEPLRQITDETDLVKALLHQQPLIVLFL